MFDLGEGDERFKKSGQRRVNALRVVGKIPKNFFSGRSKKKLNPPRSSLNFGREKERVNVQKVRNLLKSRTAKRRKLGGTICERMK